MKIPKEELPSQKEWTLFIANIGKLLSSKFIPVYTPTSNIGTYQFYYISPTLTHYIWRKKLFKITIVVPSYWNKLKQCQVNRIKKCTEWHYSGLLFFALCAFSFYAFLLFRDLYFKSRIEWMYHNLTTFQLVTILAVLNFCCWAAMKYFPF